MFDSLPCLKCGEVGACLSVDLADGVTVRCPECDGVYDADEAEQLLGNFLLWQKVLDWLLAHPARRQPAGAVAEAA